MGERGTGQYCTWAGLRIGIGWCLPASSVAVAIYEPRLNTPSARGRRGNDDSCGGQSRPRLDHGRACARSRRCRMTWFLLARNALVDLWPLAPGCHWPELARIGLWTKYFMARRNKTVARKLWGNTPELFGPFHTLALDWDSLPVASARLRLRQSDLNLMHTMTAKRYRTRKIAEIHEERQHYDRRPTGKGYRGVEVLGTMSQGLCLAQVTGPEELHSRMCRNPCV